MRMLMLVLGSLFGLGAIALAATAADVEPSPEIRDGGLSAPDGGAPPAGQIVVKFRPGVPAAEAASLHANQRAALLKAQPRSGLHRLQLPPSANVTQVLAAYRNHPLVEEAGLNHVARLLDAPNDTNYSYQWHLKDTDGGLRAESAWDLATSAGGGVVVAVIDTGVAFESHSRNYGGFIGTKNFALAPDLNGKTFVAPWNFVHDDAHPNDDHGHGTHVAGTIAQDTNDNYGAAGVAYNATMMPIKVLDFSGSGNSDDLVEAIYHAIANGADVINISLGFPGTGAPDGNGEVCTEIVGLNAALDAAYAAGIVVVAAAGNDGGMVSCPAAHPTVISVAATDYLGNRSSYSNHGAELDVAAPGGDPNVDLNGDGFSDGVFQETYCNPGSWILLTGHFNQFCTVVMSGTSMASPHVAGVAALLLGEDPSLTPDTVRDILQGTARERGAAGWDPLYGWGLVDASAAVAAVTGGDPGATATPTNTPTSTPTATDTPVNPTDTPTATPTFTPQPNTPTPAPCPPGQVKKGLCGGTPTLTPTPTPTSGGGGPTPTPCPAGWIKRGRC